jgi:hypothetical protein
MTAVVRKSSVFWDIMSCSPLKVNGSFRGTCRLHLQGRRISQSKTSMKQLVRLLAVREIRGGVPPKRRMTFSGLHGVMSQKVQLLDLQMVYYYEYCILVASHASTPPSVLRRRGTECHEMAESPLLGLRTRGVVAK